MPRLIGFNFTFMLPFQLHRDAFSSTILVGYDPNFPMGKDFCGSLSFYQYFGKTHLTYGSAFA
jgi:hypothetical protein